MRIQTEIGTAEAVQRRARVHISSHELATAHLHLASAAQRNRTDRYMRRHNSRLDPQHVGRGNAGPNNPCRSPEEPAKLPIPAHLEAMREARMLPPANPVVRHGQRAFGSESIMLAATISDLAANLLRPSFHRDGLGEHRLFFFDAEPIEARPYWCLCLFESSSGLGELAFRQIRFSPRRDQAFDMSGNGLLREGLVWAAALVPLVVDGCAQPPVVIAQSNYDLRQIIGRDKESAIRYAYEGWFDEWDERVAEVVSEHLQAGEPLKRFYHNVLGIDGDGNIHIRQQDATLPGLAEELVADGIVAAGLLDSGGSCALYDVWMADYINHGWYFREPRGAVLVFELQSSQRLPKSSADSWVHRRGDA